jgi:Fe-S cluster assembly iron-binding protein IscA
MLELSPAAVTYVQERRRAFELPESAGLRIWLDPERERWSMKIGFRREPSMEDDVIEQTGARVFVAPELVDALTGRLLDVNDEADPPRLVLRSPGRGRE